MSFTNQEIRTLRQRLGWSIAEMARQLGCSSELICKWETGGLLPSSEVLNQLRYLKSHVENNSEQMSQKPALEREMESRRVGQMTHRDLLKDN